MIIILVKSKIKAQAEQAIDTEHYLLIDTEVNIAYGHVHCTNAATDNNHNIIGVNAIVYPKA